jgi:hypothetical protein
MYMSNQFFLSGYVTAFLHDSQRGRPGYSSSSGTYFSVCPKKETLPIATFPLTQPLRSSLLNAIRWEYHRGDFRIFQYIGREVYVTDQNF